MPSANGNGALASDADPLPPPPPPPASPSQPTLYLAPLVHSRSLADLEIIPLALLCVAGSTIAWVERLASPADAPAAAAAHGIEYAAARTVVVDEGFLCPGFIDTHTYPNNGLGHSLQLLDWLEALTFPLESKFADPKFARSIYDTVVKRNLAAGTTTACYYGTLHATTTQLADACVAIGQRALVGRCCMDTGHDTYVESSAAASMAATHAFLDHFGQYAAGDAARVRPILTPRFALSCTPELMGDLGTLAAERDLPVQTHISENHAEIALVKSLFGSDTYAGVYARYGLLRRGTVLAHAVHLDPAERAIVAASGAGVSHCPGSNVHLNSGAARVLDMLGAGIPVGLGSDCSGGPATGVLAALRDAGALSRVLAFEGAADRGLTAPELFFLATRGGAQLCRLDDVGAFMPGAQFDALLVKPRSPGMWVREGEPVADVFEKWLFAGDDRDIVAVWVAGQQVVAKE